MNTNQALEWVKKHYGFAIESYPVQQDCTTYYYIPLYKAKEIIKEHSKLSMTDIPLSEVENQKTLFSGINSRDFAKIKLHTFVEIIKDYL